MLAATIVLIAVAVGLHVVGGVVLLNTGFSAISLHSPIAYVLMGLLLVLAALKLKHAMGMIRGKKIHTPRERPE